MCKIASTEAINAGQDLANGIGQSSTAIGQINHGSLSHIAVAPAYDHRTESGNVAISERTLAYADNRSVPPKTTEDLAQRGPDPHQFKGVYSRVGLRPGFSVAFSDMMANQDFLGTGSSSAGLSLTVMLGGAGEGWLTKPLPLGEHNPIVYAPATTYINYAVDDFVGQYMTQKGAHFRTVELRLDLSFLEHLGLRSSLHALSLNSPGAKFSADGIWIGVNHTSTFCLQIAERMHNRSRSPGSGRSDIGLEADALKLLEFSLIDFKISSQDVSCAVPNPQTNAALQRVVQMLQAEPERDWRLAEIARIVGVSVSKLKADFRAYHRQTMNTYLTSLRMERARTMIQADQSVSFTMVAFEIGYTSPSHFTKVFRRSFGLTPTEYRNSLSWN